MRRLIPSLLLLAACDSVSSGTDMPPYGTIRGSITDVHATGAPLRVALEWLAVHPDTGAIEIAEDVPVTSSGPTTYEIDLTTLPPTGAVSGFADPADATNQGLDPNLQWAQATVLVYEDVDGDGQLNVTHADGDSADHVVGQAKDITVWFVMAGTPAPLDALGGLPVAPGLSVTHATLEDPMPGACGDGVERDLCGQWYGDTALLAIPATVDIALTYDPHIDHYTCDQFWGSEEWPDFASDWNQWSPHAPELCAPGVDCYCTGTGCPLDVPPAAVPVTCNADATAFSYKTCVDDDTVAGTRFCHFGHGELAPGDPAPAGWPCP